MKAGWKPILQRQKNINMNNIKKTKEINLKKKKKKTI
jgi:hypothetical protein